MMGNNVVKAIDIGNKGVRGAKQINTEKPHEATKVDMNDHSYCLFRVSIIGCPFATETGTHEPGMD